MKLCANQDWRVRQLITIHCVVSTIALIVYVPSVAMSQSPSISGRAPAAVRIQRRVAQLREELPVAPARETEFIETLPTLRSSVADGSEMNSIQDEIERSETRDQQRIDSIRTQISLLRRIMLRRQQEGTATAKPPGRSATDATTPVTPVDVAPQTPSIVPEPTPVPDVPMISIPAVPVTQDPVDSLALANNLFAVGDTESLQLATGIYDRLLSGTNGSTTPTWDVEWIRYQLANCYRRTGDIKAAEKLYRIVASSKDAPYWAQQAQWWLQNLARMQRISERQQRIKETLQQIREETNDFKR